VKLVAEDGNVARRLDPDLNPAAPDFQHRDRDATADVELLPRLPTQHEHDWSPSLKHPANRPLPVRTRSPGAPAANRPDELPVLDDDNAVGADGPAEGGQADMSMDGGPDLFSTPPRLIRLVHSSS
jgi:hypothetical protein